MDGNTHPHLMKFLTALSCNLADTEQANPTLHSGTTPMLSVNRDTKAWGDKEAVPEENYRERWLQVGQGNDLGAH